MSTVGYPVRVDAALEPGLSRWLWLVKWLLAIPHVVVLAFLWLAFAVLTPIALVAIVLTGRYPRGIFEFNVGVLRWTWRVAYYTYGGLATDRYPPFTLHDVADYPARLEVPYPAHLSRGLVLVKWWLLAIPHYLVLGLFLGGSWYVANGGDGDPAPTTWGGGLVGLLVLVAGVVLLFTGAYPRPVFDFVLGMDRWALRVAAYAGLMTDAYPPFRLDMGGDDPGTVALLAHGPGAGDTPEGGTPVDAPGGAAGAAPVPPSGHGAAQPPPAAPADMSPAPAAPAEPGGPAAGAGPGPVARSAVPVAGAAGGVAVVASTGEGGPTGPPPGAPTAPGAPGAPTEPTEHRWGAGRVVAVVIGALLFVVGGGLLTAGLTLGLADNALRDDGYLMTDTTRVSSPGSAVVSPSIRLESYGADLGDLLGDARVTADAAAGTEVFVGIGRTSDVSAYLAGAGYSRWVDSPADSWWGSDPSYRYHEGGALPSAPTDAPFWVASASGSGTQNLTWPVEDGRWTVLVANSDGARGVVADVSMGASVPALGWLWGTLTATGLVLLVLSAVVLVLALRRRSPA